LRLGGEDALDLEASLLERKFERAKVFKGDVAENKGVRRLILHRGILTVGYFIFLEGNVVHLEAASV
jgi:hypothetical protein